MRSVIRYCSCVVLLSLVIGTLAAAPQTGPSAAKEDLPATGSDEHGEAEAPAYDWEEWGVWRVSYDSLHDRYVDSRTPLRFPDFVRFYMDVDRMRGSDEPVPEKPVCWIFPAQQENGDADLGSLTPFDLSVDVVIDAHMGVAYPPCSEVLFSEFGGSGSRMIWRGLRVGATGDLPPVPEPSPEGEPHWWQALRDVDSSLRLGDEHGNYEDFLFYEGSLVTDLAAIVQREDAHTRLKFEYVEDAVPDSAQPGRLMVRASGGVLEEELTFVATWKNLEEHTRKILVEHGLRESVAQALLTAWSPTFRHVNANTEWVVIGTEAYDELLPLTLDPEPNNKVRVGLVVVTH